MERQVHNFEKTEHLERLRWPIDELNSKVSFITGKRAHEVDEGADNRVFETGDFPEAHLSSWLHQKGRYNDHDEKSSTNERKNGFRLLVFERTLKHPPTIECSKSGILKICDEFDLASETIPAVDRLLGSFGKHFHIHSGPQRVQIVIKAFQKGELGNWMLSVNHNFDTRWTDALIIWTGWTSSEHRVMDRQWKTRISHVVAQLQAVPSLWSHPTCLPLVMLQNYSARCVDRCNMINQELVELDADLGVNQAGRLARHLAMSLDWPGSLDFKKLTIGLHSVTNSTVFVQQACNWALRCFHFLLKVEREIKQTEKLSGGLSDSIIESLDYEISSMQGVAESFDALKARGQGATSVLFNASTQRDSMLNMKIAASTKEDSISMKTFTFLTALFLPGTYVAALLSVTMINWLPNGSSASSSSPEDSGTNISQYYWVYWVLTVPLTLLVMAGWYLWYRHANQKWLRQTGLRIINQQLSAE